MVTFSKSDSIHWHKTVYDALFQSQKSSRVKSEVSKWTQYAHKQKVHSSLHIQMETELVITKQLSWLEKSLRYGRQLFAEYIFFYY